MFKRADAATMHRQKDESLNGPAENASLEAVNLIASGSKLLRTAGTSALDAPPEPIFWVGRGTSSITVQNCKIWLMPGNVTQALLDTCACLNPDTPHMVNRCTKRLFGFIRGSSALVPFGHFVPQLPTQQKAWFQSPREGEIVYISDNITLAELTIVIAFNESWPLGRYGSLVRGK